MSNEQIPLEPSDGPLKRAYKQNNQSPFFAKLPFEIRLAIYGYATRHESPVYPKWNYNQPSKLGYWHRPWHRQDKEKRLDYNNLKMICRRFYHELEGTGVFYEVNDFAFYYLNCLRYFLAKLPKDKRQHLRSIDLKHPHWNERMERDWRVSSPKLENVVGILKGCPQLRRLTFDMDGLVAGKAIESKKFRAKHYRHFPARKLFEFVKEAPRGQKGIRVLWSELLWQLPQFRLVAHVRLVRDPDEVRGEKIAIDLMDTSDLQWLRSTAGDTQGDYFGQRCGPLEDKGFRDLVIEAKMAVANCRSQLP
ncbi:hypothetical protein Hte_010057 [Hypoxylon texense]